MGRKGGPGQEGTKRPLRLAGQEEGGGETRVGVWAWLKRGAGRQGRRRAARGLCLLQSRGLRSWIRVNQCPVYAVLIKTHTFLHEPHI